jgi:hypothetical protein
MNLSGQEEFGGEGGTRTPKSLRTPDFESGTLPIRIPLRSAGL